MSEQAPGWGGPRSGPPSDWSSIPATGGERLPPTTFTVGRFLGASFSVWARQAPRFLPIGLAFAVPTGLAGWFVYHGTAAPSVDPAHPFELVVTSFSRLFLMTGVSLACSSFTTGAVVQGAAQHLRGAPVRTGDLLATALRRYLPVLLVGLLTYLAMLGTACTVVLPFILGTAWAVAVPAAVIEGSGPLEAMRRSWELTRGLRLRLLAAFLVIGVSCWATVVPVQLLGRLVLASGRSYGEGMALSQVLGAMLGGAATTLVGTATAVAYHQLREAAEGPSAGRLARVFE